MVWHLARNPRVAMHLMRCNMVPILFQGLAKPDLSDPLPLIGAFCLAVLWCIASLPPVQRTDLMNGTNLCSHEKLAAVHSCSTCCLKVYAVSRTFRQLCSRPE